MAAMETLSKLMALKKMQDDMDYRNRTYARDLRRDKIRDSQWKQSYDLQKLINNRTQEKLKRSQEFNADAATYVPRIMDAAQSAENPRAAFVQDVGEFAGDYQGVTDDFLQKSIKNYDAIYGKRPTSGRGVTVTNIEATDPDRQKAGYTRAAYIAPSGEVTYFPTVPTASTQLTQDPKNLGNIAGAKKEREEFYKYYSGLNKDAITAAKNLYKVDTMESLANEIEDIGPGQDLFRKAQQVAKIFGFDLDLKGKLGPKQVMNALTTQMELEFRNPNSQFGGGAPGALSNQEWGYLKEGVLNANTVPEGFKLLADTMRSSAERTLGIQQAIIDSGANTYSEAMKVQNQYIKDHPFKIKKTTDYSGEHTTDDYVRAMTALNNPDASEEELDNWLKENPK